jgi:response regulator RpfG family c-di-GMP phosphodiesterase
MSNEFLAVRTTPTAVLLIVNDLMQTVLLRRALSNAGYTVYTANSEDEAMATLAKTLPSMIIADWDARGFDCINMLRRIKCSSSLLYSIPVGLMSDLPTSETMCLNNKAEGVSWIVRKPVSLLGLPELIKRTLDEYRKAKLTETTFRKRRLAFAG